MKKNLNVSHKGRFIIVDGMDGAGKTTAIDILKKKHIACDIPVEVVSVWTATRFGKAARLEITDGNQKLDPHVATTMAISAVLHCYHSIVKPLLDKGITVILDRGPRSSYALQVCDQTMLGDYIPLSLWRIGFSNMIPDHEIVMVVDPEVGLKRCLDRDGVLDGVEARGVNYHRMTEQRYITSIEGRPDPLVIHNNKTLNALKIRLEQFMTTAYSNGR